MDARKELRRHADAKKARIYQRFFKTGKGEYGEGDVFIGVVMSRTRSIVKMCWNKVDLDNIKILLNSKIHEERMFGALILVKKFEKNISDRKEIYNLYLKNARRFNNWDLVDLSAPNIIGNFLKDKKDRKILYKFAKSKNLWEKRISILSCFAFIREKDFNDCLKIGEILLNDKHDLIHKAVGWMLREIGKRDKIVLIGFLKKHSGKMPRTMLRYAIEKFGEDERKKWMRK